MWLLAYFVIFWLFALVFTVVKSVRSGEIWPKSRRIRGMPVAAAIAIKIVPAAVAALLVFLIRPSAAMEINLLPGLGLFALAHIDFTATFALQALMLGLSQVALLVAAIVFLVMILYAYLLLRYLQSSRKGLGKMRAPMLFYALLISLTFSASVLLWLTSGVVLGAFVVIGAVLFIISDSLIGIRDFHHHFAKAAIAVQSTYYLAIFLRSMAVLVYAF